MGLSRGAACPASGAWWHVAVVVVALWLLYFDFAGCHATSDLIRRTEQGYVSGKIIRLPDHTEVAAFLGIPYAEAPVGPLRFKPPQKRKVWKDILNATSFGDICYQPEAIKVWDVDENDTVKTLRLRKIQSYNMSEDCLSLNVYTPKIKSDNIYLPVMVFVHGGSYYLNSGRFYRGEKIATIGVVVVTFNYRLGPLGFLSTGDTAATGNYGLLDQVLVLKWIQHNIRVFGGDKKKVTVFGNSAGAASVTFHLLSPLAEGLFSSVIAQSGCVLAPWALQSHPREHASKLAKDVGCPDSPTDKLVDCLRSHPPLIIIQKALMSNGLLVSFAPVIDGGYGGQYLFDHPENLLKDGNFKKIPFMTGVTSNEVSIWFKTNGPEMELSTMRTLVDKYAKDLLQYKNVSELNHLALSHSIMVQYFRKRGVIDDRGRGATKSITDFISDVGLKAPCVKFLQHMSNHSAEPNYMYEFSYFSKDDIKADGQTWVGSYHENELQYIFGEPHLNYSNSLRSAEDRRISNFMMKLWVNFAKYGNPTPKEDNPLNVSWQPYSDYKRVHLSIVDSPKMEENYLLENILFWNSFFPILSDYRMVTSEENKNECTEEKHRWLVWFLSSVVSLLSLTCIGLLFYVIKRRPHMKMAHTALSPESSTAV